MELYTDRINRCNASLNMAEISKFHLYLRNFELIEYLKEMMRKFCGTIQNMRASSRT